MRMLLTSIIILFMPFQVFSSEKCLEFKYGLEVNKAREFLLQTDLVFGDAVDEIDIYSASYDLNADGKPEFFYFIDNYRFCGVQTGCHIEIYEYGSKGFRSLKRYGWATFNKFDPEKNMQSKYLCIANDSTNGWRNLIFGNDNVFIYDGMHYKK